MTLIASLLFAVALAASIGAIMMTIGDAMPRIAEVIEVEFAPAMRIERKVSFGEMKGRRLAQVIDFPLAVQRRQDIRLAA